jgi:hypothetical protein
MHVCALPAACLRILVLFYIAAAFLRIWFQLFNARLCFFVEQFLRPIYRQIAENRNAEIFSANTLLVIFGTSLLTARVYIVFYSILTLHA